MLEKHHTSLRSFAVLAIVLLGGVLRLVNLNFHSLDLDESVSVWLSQKPAGDLIVNTLNLAWDPHPPGYYLLLKGWTSIFGTGEFAVRLLSALFGIAFVWLVYLAGRRFGSPTVGLTAAALCAINPLLVWLSQEVRMYMPAATFALASIYCLIRALDERRLEWWVGYVGLALAASYCHLFASLLLPVAAIYVFVRGWRRPKLWRSGALAIGTVALAYLPFARNAWHAGQTAPEINVYPDLDLVDQVFVLLQGFTLRFLPDVPEWSWIPLLLIVALIVLGLLPTRSGKRWITKLLLSLWIGIPLLAFFWINARRPAFNPKYLAPILPAFWMAAAAGIVHLGRYKKWLALPAFIVPLFLSATGWRYVWNVNALREDWRTAAAYVEQRATSQDLVFVHLHYAHIPFEYYYRGPAPVVAPLGSRPPKETDLDELLSPYTDVNVLWLVQAQEHNTDPRHVIEQWFASRGPMVTEQYPKGMSIKAYAMRYRLDGMPPHTAPTRISFGSRLQLIGYHLDQSHLRPDSERLHPPSNWIHLTLYWQIDQGLDGNFSTVVEMTDDAGGVWGGKLSQPRNVLHHYPPSRWQPGEVIRDDYDINLNPATPTGMYHIRIGVQGEQDGLLWPVSGAATSDNKAILTDIQIETSDAN